MNMFLSIRIDLYIKQYANIRLSHDNLSTIRFNSV